MASRKVRGWLPESSSARPAISEYNFYGLPSPPVQIILGRLSPLVNRELASWYETRGMSSVLKISLCVSGDSVFSVWCHSDWACSFQHLVMVMWAMPKKILYPIGNVFLKLFVPKWSVSWYLDVSEGTSERFNTESSVVSFCWFFMEGTSIVSFHKKWTSRSFITLSVCLSHNRQAYASWE